MTSSPVFLLLIGFPLKLKCAQLLLELQGRVCLRFGGFCVMATPRRIPLTTASPPVSLHSAGNHLSGTGFLHTQGFFNPPAPPCQAERTLSARMELVLFEPDDARCAEFHYPELSAVTEPTLYTTHLQLEPDRCFTDDAFLSRLKARGKGAGETLREMMGEGKDGDGDEDELQVLATMFQKKYVSCCCCCCFSLKDSSRFYTKYSTPLKEKSRVFVVFFFLKMSHIVFLFLLYLFHVLIFRQFLCM